MYGGHDRKFSTFGDSEGVVRGNPQCSCSYTSRRSRRNGPDWSEFYCCPVGGCKWSEEVPATTARPAVGSDGNWSGETASNWSGETIPAVGTGSNRSRETAPQTHTVVVGAVCSYVENSPSLEVTTVEVVAPKDNVTITALEISTTPAALNGGPRYEARTQFNLEAQTFRSGTRPAYRNRSSHCCVMM